MHTLRIGVDFDGVIANTPKLKSRVAKDVLGLDIPVELLSNSYVVGNDLMTVEQWRTLQDEVYSGNPHWHEVLEPMDGALDGIQALQKNGCHVECITSRAPTAIPMARRWAQAHNIELEINGTGAHPDKAHFAKERHINAFFDDDPSYLVPMVGVVGHVAVFDWPYNQHFAHEGVARVHSWEEIVRQVTSLV